MHQTPESPDSLLRSFPVSRSYFPVLQLCAVAEETAVVAWRRSCGEAAALADMTEEWVAKARRIDDVL
jgi:hypothetical protein